MLCEARGGRWGEPKEKILKIGKRPKGENHIISFLIIDICFHFFYNHNTTAYAISSAF